MLVGTGSIMFLGGLLMGFGRATGIWSEEIGSDGFYFAAGLPGTYVCLLALLPTDTRYIVYVGYALSAYMFVGAVLCMLMVAQAASRVDWKAERVCAPDYQASCIGFMSHWSAVALTGLIASITFVHTVRFARQNGEPLPPRLMLRRHFKVLRATYFLFGLWTLVYLVAMVVHDHGYARTTGFYGTLVHGVVDVGLAMVTTTRHLRSVQALMRRIGGTGSKDAAAAIAAMLNRVGVEKAMELAENSFRALPFSALSEADLRAAAPGKLVGVDLASRTVRANLGEVDAFVSHSWSDAADTKWTALEEWAAVFSQCRGGRQPLIWLDKACLDQGKIDESLACLPVFMSGCHELLVLAGPSYVHRLWCVIELFTWFRMHGDSAEKTMSVLPLLATNLDDKPGSGPAPGITPKPREGGPPANGETPPRRPRRASLFGGRRKSLAEGGRSNTGVLSVLKNSASFSSLLGGDDRPRRSDQSWRNAWRMAANAVGDPEASELTKEKKRLNMLFSLFRAQARPRHLAARQPSRDPVA